MLVLVPLMKAWNRFRWIIFFLHVFFLLQSVTRVACQSFIFAFNIIHSRSLVPSTFLLLGRGSLSVWVQSNASFRSYLGTWHLWEYSDSSIGKIEEWFTSWYYSRFVNITNYIPLGFSTWRRDGLVVSALAFGLRDPSLSYGQRYCVVFLGLMLSAFLHPGV